MKKAWWIISILALALICLIIAAHERPVVIPVVEAPAQPIAEEKTDKRALILNEFFSKRHMPLAGKGSVFVAAADAYGNDWRLLPAISVRESSGGLHACGYNAFGWGSCNGYDFSSTDEAINYVSQRLAESPLYKGKTDYEKLQVYNPPYVVPTYADEVIAIMQSIQRD